MNKKKFLEVLQQKLRHLPKEDREDAIAYYEEYFAEMNLSEEEDVTEKIGRPEDIAREILGNCAEKQLDEQKEKGGIKNSAKLIWIILLGICASPIAIPMAGALIILLLSCLLVVASIVLSIGCTGAALAVTGVFCIPCLIWAVGFAQKFVCFGMGLICIGLGILLLIATIKVAEWLVHGIAYLFQKAFYRKKVA